MDLLKMMKTLLGKDAPSDDICDFYLQTAGDIICQRRDSVEVESRFQSVQVEIAIELFNKQGIEGQTSHSENGINRTYESADVSPSLLSRVPVMIRTPFSTPRTVL